MTEQSGITGLMRVLSWLRDYFASSQTAVWAVSYWPMIAAVMIGAPLTLMPMAFDLPAWSYWLTIPLGIGAGFLGYAAAYMMMSE